MSIVIRSAITVFLFGSFIALWFWAWRKENAARYDAAARLPLEDSADSIEDSHVQSRPINLRIGL